MGIFFCCLIGAITNPSIIATIVLNPSNDINT